jgi:hypothetical protein
MIEFWSRSGDWPPDFENGVFLARAALKLGAAMFPEKWQGYEFSERGGVFAAAERIQRLEILVKAKRAALLGNLAKAVQQLSAARNALDHGELRDAVRRREATKSRLVEAMQGLSREPELRFYLSPQYDWKLRPGNPSIWRNSVWCSLFSNCQFGTDWLYVDAADLGSLVESVKRVEAIPYPGDNQAIHEASEILFSVNANKIYAHLRETYGQNSPTQDFVRSRVRELKKKGKLRLGSTGDRPARARKK